jgi:hypothetical protein
MAQHYLGVLHEYGYGVLKNTRFVVSLTLHSVLYRLTVM